MHEAGPFKVILSELLQSSPDVLGNPYADHSAAELARLFNLDDQMASSIISAVPIIVLDGLSARVAGIVRDRLADLARAGCKIVTTDDPSDTIPRVNWPELPAIAHVSEDHDAQAGGLGPIVRSNGAGAFECPCCGATFQIVPQGASSPPPPPPARRPVSDPSVRTPATSPAQAPPAADDWMNPLGTASSSAGRPTPNEPRGRLDDASLLAYRRAEAAPAQPPSQRSAPPPPPPQQQGLQVDFTESSAENLGLQQHRPAASSPSSDPFDAPAADPFDAGAPDPFSEAAPDPFSDEDPFAEQRAAPASANMGGSSFEASGTLHDSGSDILELDSPAREKSAPSFEDELFEPKPAHAGSRKPSLESLDDLELLDDSADRPPSRGRRAGRKAFKDTDDSLSILEDSQDDQASGRPDLDEVLSMFGPEDQQPLDDMSGLEPQPLDLSPGTRRSSRGSGDPFQDELSDILEPLNPTEAMEIIKSQKGRPRGGGRGAESLGPLDNDEESLDIFADSAPPKRSKRKKTRGVPFSASDEDLALFEENRGSSKRSGKRSGKDKKKKTDPFARARRAIEKDEPARKKSTRNGRSSRSKRSRAAGAAPKGNGDHGLVLSRISDPDKKEKAAELIAEIKGCSIDSAHRLTDRTIIPVLKGVSRDVAEFHLDKFKRYKIAGRVTTRQRS